MSPHPYRWGNLDIDTHTGRTPIEMKAELHRPRDTKFVTNHQLGGGLEHRLPPGLRRNLPH